MTTRLLQRMTTVGFVVALLLAISLPLSAGGAKGWRERTWPEHHARIDRAVETARAVDASDRAYPEDFEVARALLARATRPLPLGSVEGAWQVRSLQVNDHGTFAYPWFRSRIVRAQAGLRFEKSTGSQRRTGLLLPHGDGRSLVFVGGATVNDDPPVAYSAVSKDGNPADSDSVGRLLRIGPRELLLVLDASGGRYELYHLRR